MTFVLAMHAVARGGGPNSFMCSSCGLVKHCREGRFYVAGLHIQAGGGVEVMRRVREEPSEGALGLSSCGSHAGLSFSASPVTGSEMDWLGPPQQPGLGSFLFFSTFFFHSSIAAFC